MDAPMTGTDSRGETIREIVARETNIDRSLLTDEATIEQLGIASIDLTLAVFELEKKFDIEIPVIAANEGAEFRTVGDLIGHVIAALDRREALAPSDGTDEAVARGAA